MPAIDQDYPPAQFEFGEDIEGQDILGNNPFDEKLPTFAAATQNSRVLDTVHDVQRATDNRVCQMKQFLAEHFKDNSELNFNQLQGNKIQNFMDLLAIQKEGQY